LINLLLAHYPEYTERIKLWYQQIKVRCRAQIACGQGGQRGSAVGCRRCSPGSHP